MSDPTSEWFAAAPWVTHERLDDEVMAIDLETGVYFALDDAAADAWTLLAAGVEAARVVEALADRYAVDADQVRVDVGKFTEALVAARLLVPADPVPPGPEPILPGPAGPLRYGAPSLRRYDDLEALLRIDPVHEVDDAGWPIPRGD